jgi:hypothetical protein
MDNRNKQDRIERAVALADRGAFFADSVYAVVLDETHKPSASLGLSAISVRTSVSVSCSLAAIALLLAAETLDDEPTAP